MTETSWYHGGVPGLKRGAKILPPSVTGALSVSDKVLGGTDDMRAQVEAVHDRNAVYLARDPLAARLWASLHPAHGGKHRGGDLYEVRPDGPLCPDPDYLADDGGSMTCCSATIIRVVERAGAAADPGSDRVPGRHPVSDSLCRCGCGEPLGDRVRRGMRGACYSRFVRQGKPEGGPRPALTAAEATARARATLAAQRSDVAGLDEPYEPDDYDLRWAEGEPERRIDRVKGQAAGFARAVPRRDGAGVARLLERVTDKDAVIILLAECADPAKVQAVCGVPVLAAVPQSPVLPATASPDPAQAVSVDPDAIDDAAA